MSRLNLSLVLLAVLTSLAASKALAEADEKKGREIAIEHCSRCHVVPDHNPHGGIGSTPSFRLLAKLKDGLERFDTFFDRRPHPSFVRIDGIEPPTDLPVALEPVRLKIEDLDDIKAYARLLRESQE